MFSKQKINVKRVINSTLMKSVISCFEFLETDKFK